MQIHCILDFHICPLGFLDGVNFTDIDDPILYECEEWTQVFGKGFFELKRI